MQVENLSAITAARLRLVDQRATVQNAALSFSYPGTGLLVVCGQDGIAVGVLSKSDLIRHMTQPARLKASVGMLMQRNVMSCRPQDDLYAVWQMMTTRRLQNMPVLTRGSKPVGLLDLRDVLRVLFEQELLQENMLADYISGIGYR
jgi:signal-transduction protein with cAMP-binding, CBS, and nucleotidyltransferase domain